MMFTIGDIKLGVDDSTGAKIIGVYTKIENAYAIYRTEERVMVQFSDDAVLGADQRKLIAPLGPVRGEINGLIDGWRKADRKNIPGLAGILARMRPISDHDRIAKAALFDRRVADALAVALQGGDAEAAAILAVVKADVLEERTSVARTEYVLVAASILLILMAIDLLVTWWAGPDAAVEPGTLPLRIGANSAGFAAAMGALGALFSIALAIRSRDTFTDLQSLDNVIDATMRMLIGAISAFLLYCLLGAGYFSFNFGETSPALQLQAWQPGLAVIGFVAGFSERLVGDALSRAVLGKVPGGGANPVGGGVASRSGQAAQANELNPLGRVAEGAGGSAAAGSAGGGGAVAPANDDEETSEGGHQTADLVDEQLTADVELPEAVGGVEGTN